ncbi:MAG TPA: PEP-CTERM sorting domain-containing protein [Tepidisphaeraceae bacterium]|nr:PEP-CTERM sorting domain-containing protein [Tepidisphaeraceae bacterium]
MAKSSRANGAQRVSLGMCVRKCALVVGASLAISSAALAVNPNAKPTAGVYDEQTIQANRVDLTATDSSFSAARFAARVRDGYLNDTGGVIDGAFFAELYSFGTSNSKVFDIIWNNNLLFTPSATTVSPISGLSAFGTGDKNVTIDIQPIAEGGAVGEKTVEMGLTALSQNSANFGLVTVKAILDNGQQVSANRNISEPLGQGDTFFGFRAPPGRYIKQLNITHNHPTSTRMYFDDVAFRTAVVAPFRAEKLPAVDVAAESNGGGFFIADGSQSINVRDIGGTRRRMVMEFNVADIGSDIVDALLEVDVTAASSGSNTLSVLGYAGDGVVTPEDAGQAGTLLATRTIEGSGLLAISLNAAAVKNLMGSSTHLGLILSESSGAEMTINTSENSSALLKPTLTIDYSAVPEPTTAFGLLGVGVLTLSRRRRAGWW